MSQVFIVHLFRALISFFKIVDPAFDQFRNWLESLGAGMFVNSFASAGYDLAFIRRHGLTEADLDCVTIPATKLGLRKKLIALHNLENFIPEESAVSEVEESDEASESSRG